MSIHLFYTIQWSLAKIRLIHICVLRLNWGTLSKCWNWPSQVITWVSVRLYLLSLGQQQEYIMQREKKAMWHCCVYEEVIAVLQSSNNCRNSLCMGELEHPPDPVTWVSRIRAECVSVYGRANMRKKPWAENWKYVSEKDKCVNVCACVSCLLVKRKSN